MARRSDGLRTEKRILSTCVQLFLQNGYHKTTMQQICKTAGVSASSFQHLFGNKDGVLVQLMRFMYDSQFEAASSAGAEHLPPVYVYAMETAIQLALTDLNENIRDCYLEAYTYPESVDEIQRRTAEKLHAIFGPFQPELTVHDFYVLDFGSAGMMRGFMANPVSDEVTLEQKVEAFLTQALRGFKVPEDQVQQTVAFVLSQDIRAVALQVMDKLFRALAVRYDFPLEGILPQETADSEAAVASE